ncbi:hypothetical protein BD289DRAFT_212119 [Coniella lustricola]|uniref:Uncharacterized protein n=1 Tax=Coniella lustricola TaxID=2025994 RepID=A0A2T3ABI4_9PEZI|nr:hypothetical protein BD289DRAFT_212119 [Coniella lustricola]
MHSVKSSKGKSVDWDSQSQQSLTLSEYDYMASEGCSFRSPRTFIPPELPPARYQHAELPNSYDYAPRQHAPPQNSHSQYWPGQSDGWAPAFRYDDRDGKGEQEMAQARSEEGDSVVSSGRASSTAPSTWDSTSTCSDATVSTMRGTIPPPSVTSNASTAPSRHSNLSTVETHIHRQTSARQRHELPCEFCGQLFFADDDLAWKDHTETHLGNSYPARVRCCEYEVLETQVAPRALERRANL